MVGCNKLLFDGDTAYWLDKENKMVGSAYDTEPVEIIERDFCGLLFHGDSIICEFCCKKAGIIW